MEDCQSFDVKLGPSFPQDSKINTLELSSEDGVETSFER